MRRMISERERAPLKNMGFDEENNTVEIGTNVEIDGKLKVNTMDLTPHYYNNVFELDPALLEYNPSLLSQTTIIIGNLAYCHISFYLHTIPQESIRLLDINTDILPLSDIHCHMVNLSVSGSRTSASNAKTLPNTFIQVSPDNKARIYTYSINTDTSIKYYDCWFMIALENAPENI